MISVTVRKYLVQLSRNTQRSVINAREQNGLFFIFHHDTRHFRGFQTATRGCPRSWSSRPINSRVSSENQNALRIAMVLSFEKFLTERCAVQTTERIVNIIARVRHSDTFAGLTRSGKTFNRGRYPCVLFPRRVHVIVPQMNARNPLRREKSPRCYNRVGEFACERPRSGRPEIKVGIAFAATHTTSIRKTPPSKRVISRVFHEYPLNHLTLVVQLDTSSRPFQGLLVRSALLIIICHHNTRIRYRSPSCHCTPIVM